MNQRRPSSSVLLYPSPLCYKDSSCPFPDRPSQSRSLPPRTRGPDAVFLSEPSETPFDLQFWLFGTHVRGQPVVLAYRRGPRLGHRRRRGRGPWCTWPSGWSACLLRCCCTSSATSGWAGCSAATATSSCTASAASPSAATPSTAAGSVLVSFAGPLIQFVLLGALIAASPFILPAVPMQLAESRRR